MKLFEVIGNVEIPPEMEYPMRNLVSWPYQVDYYNGGDLHWEFRRAARNEEIARSYIITTGWHQDGNRDGMLILWSDAYQTEVLLPDGNIVSGKPNDVILINNSLVQHRVPERYVNDTRAGIQKPRRLIRAYSKKVPSDSQIEQWKRELAS